VVVITDTARAWFFYSVYTIKIETKCPKCNGDCIFKWQEFNDGSRHIRQECPVHGFIRYAPKIEPYLTIVTQAKKKTIQKKNVLIIEPY